MACCRRGVMTVCAVCSTAQHGTGTGQRDTAQRSCPPEDVCGRDDGLHPRLLISVNHVHAVDALVHNLRTCCNENLDETSKCGI